MKSLIIQTPCIIYNLSELENNIEFFKKNMPKSCRIVYATMANTRIEVLKLLYNKGIGFFVNSISHLKILQANHFDGNEIVFAASGNDFIEMKQVDDSTAKFYADSVNQVELYFKIESSKKIGLRLNLASLLDYELELPFFSRIGIDYDDAIYLLLKYTDSIDALHIYCGTNSNSSSLYITCLKRIVEMIHMFRNIKSIDLGGGFPSIDNPSAEKILLEISRFWNVHMHDFGISLLIEPGRALTDNIASFYVTVTDVKLIKGSCIAIVNSSYTCYPRKVLHRTNEQRVFILGKESANDKIEVTICGKSTFSNDILSVALLPKPYIGDIIYFANAGAYIENSYISYLGIEKPTVFVND